MSRGASVLDRASAIVRVAAAALAGVAVISSAATSSAAAVGNASFETPVQTSYTYNPTGATWTFSGAGIQRNGSAWGAASAPDGTQTAFIQNLGSISQAINFTAGTYTVSFKAAQRACCSVGYSQPLRFTVDGVAVGGLISPTSTSFAMYSTDSFTVTTGTHTIALTGTDNSGDRSSFVDLVQVTQQATTTTTKAPTPTCSMGGSYVTNGTAGDVLLYPLSTTDATIEKVLLTDVGAQNSHVAMIADQAAGFITDDKASLSGVYPANQTNSCSLPIATDFLQNIPPGVRTVPADTEGTIATILHGGSPKGYCTSSAIIGFPQYKIHSYATPVANGADGSNDGNCAAYLSSSCGVPYVGGINIPVNSAPSDVFNAVYQIVVANIPWYASLGCGGVSNDEISTRGGMQVLNEFFFGRGTSNFNTNTGVSYPQDNLYVVGPSVFNGQWPLTASPGSTPDGISAAFHGFRETANFASGTSYNCWCTDDADGYAYQYDPATQKCIPVTVTSIYDVSTGLANTATIGGTIQIFGQAFDAHVNAVSIGSTSLQVTYNSTTQINAVVPGGLATGTQALTVYAGLPAGIYGSGFSMPDPFWVNVKTSAPPPTASLLVNGVASLTATVGTSVNFTWTSTNAASASSTVTMSPHADTCGNVQGGAWVANTLAGSAPGTAAACQQGVTYTLTYKVVSSTGQSATSTVTLTVPAVASCTYYCSTYASYGCGTANQCCSFGGWACDSAGQCLVNNGCTYGGGSPSVTCSFSAPTSIAYGGYWSPLNITSNPSGYYAYWYGTHNGAQDATNVYDGITPLSQTTGPYYAAGDQYTRYLVLRDGSGNAVCTTNTITVTVAP